MQWLVIVPTVALAAVLPSSLQMTGHEGHCLRLSCSTHTGPVGGLLAEGQLWCWGVLSLRKRGGKIHNEVVIKAAVGSSGVGLAFQSCPR